MDIFVAQDPTILCLQGESKK